MRRMINAEKQEVLDNLRVSDGKVQVYVEGTPSEMKYATNSFSDNTTLATGVTYVDHTGWLNAPALPYLVSEGEIAWDNTVQGITINDGTTNWYADSTISTSVKFTGGTVTSAGQSYAGYTAGSDGGWKDISHAE